MTQLRTHLRERVDVGQARGLGAVGCDYGYSFWDRGRGGRGSERGGGRGSWGRLRSVP
jgi:hypothetical protein